MFSPTIKWYILSSTERGKTMGQILHGTATTTHAIRAKIQASEASIREIAEQHHINPKTARKWKNRDSVEDLTCGAKPGQGSVLTDGDEAILIEDPSQDLAAPGRSLRPAQSFDSRANALQPAPLPATSWRQSSCRLVTAGRKRANQAF